MHAFLEACTFRYETFALDSKDDIWRIWFDDTSDQPFMQKLIGSDPQYQAVARLLRARRDLYGS